jgi:hypothetical protein
MVRTILVLAVVLASLAAIAAGCGDLGKDPAGGPLVPSVASVTLAPGGSRTVTLTGGNPPYAVAEYPNAALAAASLTNNADRSGSLLITAPSSATVGGSTFVKVKDTEPAEGVSGGPLTSENEITIPITIASAGMPVLIGGPDR